jgi:hypothetical protein
MVTVHELMCWIMYLFVETERHSRQSIALRKAPLVDYVQYNTMNSDPGVDVTPDRNEYQEYFLRGKATGA